MIKKILSAVCFGLIVALVAPVQADITFGIDPLMTTVDVGSSGTLIFFAEGGTAAEQAEVARSYQFGMTVTGTGVLPSQLQFNTPVTNLRPTWNTPNFNASGSALYGASASVGGGTPRALDFDTGPAPAMAPRLNLFSVGFTVLGGSTGDTFELDIQPVSFGGVTVNPTLLSNAAGNPNLITGSAGVESTITVGIPEPTSLCFLMGAAGLVALCRRRKSA